MRTNRLVRRLGAGLPEPAVAFGSIALRGNGPRRIAAIEGVVIDHRNDQVWAIDSANMAQPGTPLSSPTSNGSQNQSSPHPVTPPRSRTLLYAVVAIVVVVAVILAVLVAGGLFSPKPSPKPMPKPKVVTMQLIDTPSSTFGPGTTNAAVLVATLPTNYSSAWINGSLTVTGCTSVGNYCLAKAAIFTPTDWQNFESGGTVSVIWCYSIQGTCQAEQTTVISSGDLTGYWGQALDVCLWSNATTESQQYSASISLTYIIPG